MGTASYLLLSDASFQSTISKLQAHMFSCNLCPHGCFANRNYGIFGMCKAGKTTRVAGYLVQHGEEPVISGSNGSGVIRFSYCEVMCSFCNTFTSNYDGVGTDITILELSKIMLDLQSKGCHNIQFVTPTMFLPQIIEALYLARQSGLTLPIVYNSSGFERLYILKMLRGIVDIYMPDFKFASTETSDYFTVTSDYCNYTLASIIEMLRQVGNISSEHNYQNVATKGLIVRHLMLPGMLQDSFSIMNILSQISSEIYFSLLGSYLPTERTKAFPEIDKGLSEEDFKLGVEKRKEIGLINGWNYR